MEEISSINNKNGPSESDVIWSSINIWRLAVDSKCASPLAARFPDRLIPDLMPWLWSYLCWWSAAAELFQQSRCPGMKLGGIFLHRTAHGIKIIIHYTGSKNVNKNWAIIENVWKLISNIFREENWSRTRCGPDSGTLRRRHLLLVQWSGSHSANWYSLAWHWVDLSFSVNFPV